MTERDDNVYKAKLAEQAERYDGEDSPDFYFWYRGHAPNCQINHEGSSGWMEISAASSIWKRSLELGFRYLTMVSDGDTKTYDHLCKLMIYGPNYKIIKEECVNHVGKRLHVGIVNIVKEERSRKITLGRKKYGQLKEITIRKLSEYYKRAIDNNKGNIQAMKNAILASIYHCASTDENPRHTLCPEGPSSWCFYNNARARGITPGSHESKINTPVNELCLEKVLPLYEKLTDEALLVCCARCLTQNANECLHSMIWNKCPKENFVSKSRVVIAA